MTPAGELLAREIRASGPVAFRRFMDVALYHPEHGYYRRMVDPFGKEGDFFTAEQVQPVFGILVAARIRQLFQEMGRPADFTVVELGAGRQEMAEAFSEWRYVAVDLNLGGGSKELPAHFRGVLFSNEFFDALPVEAVVYRDGAFRRQLVNLDGDSFVWHEGAPVDAGTADYLARFFPPPEEGRWYEVNLDALRWLERISRSLDAGYMLTIDYGFTRKESVRFPAGTLMGYRRHIARDNVLDEPGVRDITAHVNFTALEEHGELLGLRKKNFQSLAQMLLEAGEADQFAAALGTDDMRRRLQLKTLLFGMGETFRVLLQEREEGK
jgi:SAM-dependent MidA family methyltransferase